MSDKVKHTKKRKLAKCSCGNKLGAYGDDKHCHECILGIEEGRNIALMSIKEPEARQAIAQAKGEKV